MEIRSKELYKSEIKNKIEKYKKEFPVYFFGNLFVNLFLIGLVCVSFSISLLLIKAIMGTGVDMGGSGYGIVFGFFISVVVLPITLKGLFKNIQILNRIRKGDYSFGAENYELDNVVEFLGSLPKTKKEIDEMRVELSFNKLIDVLEAVKIIRYDGGEYKIDRVFDNDMEEKIYEKSEGEKLLEQNQRIKNSKNI